MRKVYQFVVEVVVEAALWQGPEPFKVFCLLVILCTIGWIYVLP